MPEPRYAPAREDGTKPYVRRCSMTAIMDGPYRCASGDCMGHREDCSVPRVMAAESRVLAAMQESVEVENAWAKALGLPVKTPTIRDARRVVSRYRLEASPEDVTNLKEYR
jgi:hypothetical protein